MADPDSLIQQPRRTLASSLPIVAWLPRYRWKRDFPVDLVAGIALAALLIPEAMGYAGVAGAPAEVGLYAALGAIIAYAVTGGTSILVVGPAAAVAALSATIVADFTGDTSPLVLLSALAVTSGIVLLGAGLLRLGWVVNFISRPVLEAFVSGLAISIIVGQLDGLLGVEGTDGAPVVQFFRMVTDLGSVHGLTAVLGVIALVAIVTVERISRKVPAALVAVVVGIAAVVVFDLGSQGVAVVGEIPTGLPDVGLPQLSGLRWLELLGAGVALLLVGFSEGYAAASSVASQTGEEIDPDQELIGSGAANIAAGFVGGLPVSGGLSKSAASQANGARSQMTNLVCGAVVLATLLFLAPVFRDLPEPVLAAIVITAVLHAADPRQIFATWNLNRLDFVAATVTFSLVLVWETLPALIVGVVLSLAFVVHRASFPDVIELDEADDGTFVARSGPEEHHLDDTAILRFEAPLIYANADRLVRSANALVKRRPDATRLVLDAEMMSDLDMSGAEQLEKLDDQLAERGIELHLARCHHRARAQLGRSHLDIRFKERIHDRLRDAVGHT